MHERASSIRLYFLQPFKKQISKKQDLDGQAGRDEREFITTDGAF